MNVETAIRVEELIKELKTVQAECFAAINRLVSSPDIDKAQMHQEVEKMQDQIQRIKTKLEAVKRSHRR
jgi:Spy/CpxP family protein refolding chaperone